MSRDVHNSTHWLRPRNPPSPSHRIWTCTLQRQNTKISKQIFPEKEYRGLSPNFHIHASVSDLYISTIGLGLGLGLYIEIAHRHMNVEIGTRPRYSQKRNTWDFRCSVCEGAFGQQR
jgi:hypothetical protein